MPSKFPWSKSNRPTASTGNAIDVSITQSSASHDSIPSPQKSPLHLDSYFRRSDKAAIDTSGQASSSSFTSNTDYRESYDQTFGGASTSDQQAFYNQKQDSQTEGREGKKSGLRSKLGLGHSAKDSAQSESSRPHSKGFGRAASVKRKEIINLTPSNNLSTDQVSIPTQYSSGYNSLQLSPPAAEGQESVGLDPFLIQPDHTRQSLSLKSSSSVQSSAYAQQEQHQKIYTSNPPQYTSSRTQDYQAQYPQLNPADRLVGSNQQHLQDPYNPKLTQQQPQSYSYQNYQTSKLPEYQHPDSLLSQPPHSPSYPPQNQQYHPQDYNSHARGFSEGSDTLDAPKLLQQHNQQAQYHQNLSPHQQQALDPRTQRPSSRPQSQSRNTSFIGERTSSRAQEQTNNTQERRLQAESGPSDKMRSATTASRRTAEDSGFGQGQQQATSNIQSPLFTASSFNGSNNSGASNSGPYNRSGSKLSQHDDDSGRRTPSQLASSTDLTKEEVKDLVKEYNQLTKEHKVLREKYDKVKRYYFDKDTQVHKLQNTIANLQMSLNRTSLDDNEYSARFSRLDGLIAQLAFSIRKSWKSIPNWMQPVVNKEAISTGKQEMTAVGRAFISAWLVDGVFNKYFHPDLEPGLSAQLKSVHRNLRLCAPTSRSVEEEEILNSKIISWRLATLDGLQDELRITQEKNNRRRLIDHLHGKLMDAMKLYLYDPPPPDLDGGVNMIVDLAISSIAIHLPCESREVQIEYFQPGSVLQPELMKVETGGIPSLLNPSAEDWERSSMVSSSTGQESEARNSSEADPSTTTATPSMREGDGKSRRNVLSSLIGRKAPSSQQNSDAKQVIEGEDGQGVVARSIQARKEDSAVGGATSASAARVRLAVFLAVKIEGRSILVKSQVFST